MPIYAYRCDACGHAKDVLQKLSDPVLTTCPACGAEGFRKQLTAAGFQLKGSGWYVTDFKGGAAKPAEAAKHGDAKPGEAKPAESKPAEPSSGTSSSSSGSSSGSSGSDGGGTGASSAAPAAGCGGGCACH